jgi:hypothetical protein
MGRISSVQIDPAFTVSNAMEALQDVSIAGALTAQSVATTSLSVGTLSNPQLSSLSNQLQMVASSLVGVSNQVLTNSTFISTLQTQSTWTSNLAISLSNSTSGFSNDIYPRYTFTSNQSVFSSNTFTFGSNCSIFSSNAAVAAQTTANFGCNASVFGSNYSVWTSNNFRNVSTTTSLATFSNFVSPIAIFGSNLFPSICNLSNAFVSTSNGLFPSLCNLSNAYVSTSSNLFPSLCNLSNAFMGDTAKATFGLNTSVFTSNNLSNYRLTATAIDYSTLTNKALFDSTNNALSVVFAVLGSAGLAFGAYKLFNGSGYVNGIFQTVANATTDFIELASGYQKLTNYIEIGVATTRYADGVITLKSNTTTSCLHIRIWRP